MPFWLADWLKIIIFMMISLNLILVFLLLNLWKKLLHILELHHLPAILIWTLYMFRIFTTYKQTSRIRLVREIKFNLSNQSLFSMLSSTAIHCYHLVFSLFDCIKHFIIIKINMCNKRIHIYHIDRVKQVIMPWF